MIPTAYTAAAFELHENGARDSQKTTPEQNAKHSAVVLNLKRENAARLINARSLNC